MTVQDECGRAGMSVHDSSQNESETVTVGANELKVKDNYFIWG